MRYVAFLRGMNLGRRRVTNAELCGCFRALGFPEVAAFQASGNVIFTADESADDVAEVLESGLADDLGYDVPVFVRGAEQVAKLARHTPFAGKSRKEAGKIQVMFLGRNAAPKSALKASSLATADDWLEPLEHELLWWPAGGLKQSSLDLKAVESICGPVTIRTRNTALRLAAKLASS